MNSRTQNKSNVPTQMFFIAVSRPTIIAMLRAYFKSYCEKSTVHGVFYIGHSRSHIVERFRKFNQLAIAARKYFLNRIIFRIFWSFSLIVSLTLTGLMISELIEKLNKTPIVISLDDTPIHVSEIYFPSVTICPGISPIVDSVDYKEFVDEIKSGQINLTQFTDQE